MMVFGVTEVFSGDSRSTGQYSVTLLFVPGEVFSGNSVVLDSPLVDLLLHTADGCAESYYP